MFTRCSHGYAGFALGDADPREMVVPNLSHDFNAQHLFEGFVRSGYWARYSRLGVRPTFRRHSALRPYVANTRHRGRQLHQGWSTYSNEWEQAQDWEGSIGGGNGVNTNLGGGPAQILRSYGRTYTLAAISSAIGSYVISFTGTENGLSHGSYAANGQASSFYEEALSEVDLPQTTIGNIHKHPYARGAYFNETSIVPLSQGSIVLSGVFNPPEYKLGHMGHQVYYAKSGGTGVIQGAVKTTGETFPAGTSAARFRDTTYNAFISGDVGKYIAIHNVGIYLITNFVDSANVDVDAVTINEPFTNVTGRTWTLRTGPIGEYFWRRRPYGLHDSWVNYSYPVYSEYWFCAIDEILHGFSTNRTEWNQLPQRVVYDGYSHWWWTVPNRPTAGIAYGLLRHLHMSPQPMQAPVADGSLTGFTNWAPTSTTPTGGWWEDIIVDKNKKLWISARAAAVTQNILARIDPAPSGNAGAPVVEAQWRKQQNDADAAGLTASDVIAMCDDRSGVFSGGAGTHRIWCLGGNGEVAGLAGGLSYTDDEGTTWRRIHQLPPTLVGTASATNGNAAVTGSSTTFTTSYTVGDYIRFGTDVQAYRILTITNNTSLTLATTYAGTTGSGKTHAKVQKGQVSVTNGSGAVSATEGAFTTDLAVGDWVRFSTDTRSYRITAITDANNLTITPTYQGTTASPVCIRRGALDATEAIGKTGYSFTNNGSGNSDGQHNIDWDSQGRVYWLSQNSPTRICRWDPGTGAVVSFAETAIAAVTNLSAIASGHVVNLKVTRIPNVAGVGTHPFHDDIWLGCRDNGNSSTNGGWIRVIGSTFTASPTGANFTRYHYNTTDTFPTSVLVPSDGSGTFCGNPRVLQEPITGNILLSSGYSKDTDGRLGWHWMTMTGTSYWKPTQNHVYAADRGLGVAAGTREPYARAAFDETGMGYACIVSGQDSGGAVQQQEPPLTLSMTVWIDRRWNGTTWVPALLGGSTIYDFNLRGGTNANTQSAVLGNGFRRMHEWAKPLEDGLYIAFQQAGGAVAQTDEFLADEASTFVCYIGAGKDNTQTCSVYYDMHMNPTVYRANTEPTGVIRNLWTTDNAVEGGYTQSNTGSLTATIPFVRGAGDYHKYPAGYGTAAGYLNTNNATINSSLASQPMMALRIPDEGEFTGDGSVTAGLATFTSAGAHPFVSGDVGKSIFVEGANGNTADVDNGQAVILSVSSGVATTDKVFATTRSGLRWKLRNVPAVSFVELGFYNTPGTHPHLYWRTDLWSSRDYGQNWVLVKYNGEGNNSIPLNGPDDASPDVWYSTESGYYDQLQTGDNNGTCAPSIIFDLRALPENTRRRQYWRMRMYDPDNAQSASTYFSGIFLYDDNFKPLNRPANNKISDADNALYQACNLHKAHIIRATGTGATPIDDGNGDGLTNTVTVTENLYLTTGSNNATLGATGIFTDATAPFTRLSVGQYIRISGAANSVNNGFALITGFISTTQVQTSKNFTAETNTFNWATLAVGPGDELRIESATVARNRGTALSDSYFVITDVPTSTSITVSTGDIPHPITPTTWDIGRNMNISAGHASSITNFDTAGYMTWNHLLGTLGFSYDLEFVTVQASTVNATTPADDDADGRTDKITMGEALTAVDGPVAGDFIEIVHATYGRRVFEITSITGSDPSKVVQVKYDELPVSLTGVTWTIRRRRNLPFKVRRLVVVGKGAAIP
jgi:hypothetical protein